MSIQLLDKTRKINRLLNDKHSSKVAFADICFVLGQMLLANAYIISSKGKLLGTYVNDDGMIPSFQSKRGSYIETMFNESCTVNKRKCESGDSWFFQRRKTGS